MSKFQKRLLYFALALFSFLLCQSTLAYQLDRNDKSFYYPLPEVVPVSSPYGWRIHPITGVQRFHSGTDLGADYGMVVQSANAGTVVLADWKGGYGKTVIVRYADGEYETLYAHLSEVLVVQGQIVQGKQAIGRVGSTGNSTGPHLHFELLRRAGGSWTTVNPGSQLRAVEAYANVKPSKAPVLKAANLPGRPVPSAEEQMIEPQDQIPLSFDFPPR
jgi:murein DD-endopeptidase MepM/ murein hydrolase activator NlpD